MKTNVLEATQLESREHTEHIGTDLLSPDAKLNRSVNKTSRATINEPTSLADESSHLMQLSSLGNEVDTVKSWRKSTYRDKMKM